MATLNTETQHEVLSKLELLEETKITLKKEFVGIDSVIDEVLDSISSWYLFPDLQDKPLVVNLWGLTGVGKSSLVSRLSELIGFGEKYHHFDLGEEGGSSSSIKDELERFDLNTDGHPIIFSLDEFQHARTLDEMGTEKSKASSRIIWQLLDSGKFNIMAHRYGMSSIYQLILKLRHLLLLGVGVSNGRVVKKKDLFLRFMNIDDEDSSEEEKLLFIPKDHHKILYDLAPKKFTSPFLVQEKVNHLSGEESILFLEKVFETGNSPCVINCSKSLIFVMGNLDEAYKMSHNFNPDMDADDFHEQSLKITVPIIKKELKRRFRNEQIARLGNTHIIYPAFNKKGFKAIIDLELSRVSLKMQKERMIKLEYDNSLKSLIYQEGVYPTQGTRPVFSTIHQIVHTKLGRIMQEISMQKCSTTRVVMSYRDKKVTVDFYKGDSKLHNCKYDQVLNLDKLRNNKRDDVQAITAVHESGHAVLAMVLLNTVPEVIYSNTAAADSGGFVYTKFKWKYVAKQEILSRLAFYLGGLAAEKVVFGPERVTAGAESDIEGATSFISRMLKESGMGRVPAAYHPETREYVSDEQGGICAQSEQWIERAMELAENTLRKEEELLLKLSDYLSDYRQIDKSQAVDFLKCYAKDYNINNLIEDGDLLFYRNKLKNKVAIMNVGSGPIAANHSFQLSLNRNLKA